MNRSHSIRAVTLAALFSLEAAVTAPHAAPAAQPSIDISSQVDRSEITIGDRINYEIKVVYPTGGRIELPSVLGNLGSFEVKDYQASDPKPAGTLQIQTWHLNLSTFTVGKYMIPPQQVVFIPEGAVSKPRNDSATGVDSLPPGSAVFYTQPIEINVVRTSAETVKDIADIAPPAEAATEVPWIPVGAGAAVVLALLLWLLLRRRQGAAALVKPLAPPFEEAMERLAGLNPAALVRANRARELCFLLSEVLRRYVTRRFLVDAIDMTTTEFLMAVKKLPVTLAQKEWLARFCEGTDLVKFADSPLLESEAEKLVAALKEFLNQTKPKEGPAEGETPGSAPAKKPAGAKP